MPSIIVGLRNVISRGYDWHLLSENYGDLEYDLATATYERLHVLHNSPFAPLSSTSPLDRPPGFKLHVTVGDLKISDILDIIETMFKETQPSTRRDDIVNGDDMR